MNEDNKEKLYRIAVINGDQVENVIIADALFTLESRQLIRLSEVDKAGTDLEVYVKADGQVPGCGWSYKGGEFIHPDKAERTKSELTSHLATYRYGHEVGGITWEGVDIPTERSDQQFFTDLQNRADRRPKEKFTYKAPRGVFISKTLEEFVPIAEAVYQHVQKCFNAEAVVFSKIESGEVTTLTQVEVAFDVELK